MPVTRLLRLFFRWLYHPLAFSYDWVAAVVSLGHWNDWGRSVLRFIRGSRVLELGHGPGHLQVSMRNGGLWAAGLDESRQMSRMAAYRLRRNSDSDVKLARGLAQALPFAAGSFDTLLSIFPSEYIFDPAVAAEARRVLRPDGRLIVLPVAWPSNRLLRWLFLVTGEAPAAVSETVETKMKDPFLKAGFDVEVQTRDVGAGFVLILVATRK